MATMNNTDTTRRYTKYSRHVNDSSERIDAQDINKVQENININEDAINIVKDTAFQERVYTIFENNLYTNAMFIDDYQNGMYIDKVKSNNHHLDGSLRSVSVDNKTSTASISSINIHSVHGEHIEINDLFLITNQYTPVGSRIKYYIELISGERYEITPNALKTPLHFSSNIAYGFRLITEITPNALGESPEINGYAILYWDKKVEEDLGLTNPDLKRFP